MNAITRRALNALFIVAIVLPAAIGLNLAFTPTAGAAARELRVTELADCAAEVQTTTCITQDGTLVIVSMKARDHIVKNGKVGKNGKWYVVGGERAKIKVAP